MSKRRVYLDHAASTPIQADIKAAMKGFINEDLFGNPTASHHSFGEEALEVLDRSRHDVASLFGVRDDEISFFSSASEANNTLIFGFWNRFKSQGFNVLLNPTEHKSVLEPVLWLSTQPGITFKELRIDRTGVIDLESLKDQLKSLSHKPTLVLAMTTGNEIPCRQPIKEISRLCEEAGAYLHSDLVQAVSREVISFRKDGPLSHPHFASGGSAVMSLHKLYGPKGAAVLIKPRGACTPPLVPLMRGGQQESGLRPGTHNLLPIAVAAQTISTHWGQLDVYLDHLRSCDKAFVELMAREVPGFKLTVPFSEIVPGLINFYVEDVDAPSLLNHIPHIAINRGSSCIGAGGEKFSHVPKALGLPVEVQANTLRISFGYANSLEDVAYAVSEIKAATERL